MKRSGVYARGGHDPRTHQNTAVPFPASSKPTDQICTNNARVVHRTTDRTFLGWWCGNPLRILLAEYPPRVTDPAPEPIAAAPLDQAPPEPGWRDFIASVRADIRSIGPGPTILAMLAFVVPMVGGFTLLRYTRSVGEYLKVHQEPGIYVYAGGFALTAGLALLPTWVQAIVGGYAFGLPMGLAAALFGFGGGSLIGYEIARGASGDRVVKTIAAKPKWRAVHQAFVSGRMDGGFLKTLGIVILLRLPPHSPFAMMNLILAAARVPRLPYLLGTVIGMAPRTAMWVWIGTTVPVLSDKGPGQPAWVFIGGIVLAVGVVMLLGHMANKAIERATGGEPKPSTSPG